MILCSLRDQVDIAEVQDRAFDISASDVDTFLQFVVSTWKQRYARAAVQVVLEKRSTNTWSQFLTRLRSWCAERGSQAENDWLVDRNSGPIYNPAWTLSLGEEKVEAVKWAQKIGTLFSQLIASNTK